MVADVKLKRQAGIPFGYVMEEMETQAVLALTMHMEISYPAAAQHL